MDRKDGWVLVNKVPTHVLTWGCWIEDLKENQEVMLVLPGNPGITEYYEDFVFRMYEKLRIPIWVVSHLGMEVPPKSERMPKVDQRVYSLQEQINHKEEIFKKYIPNGCKVYTVCHSLGSYIIVNLMKNSEEIAEKVQKCYMLFPMLQNMADAPYGKHLRSIPSFLVTVSIFFLHLIQFLPYSVQYRIAYVALFVSRGLWDPSTPIVQATMQLMKPQVYWNMYSLAIEEMKIIFLPDTETIDKFKNKMKFYYGATDGWCPLENYEYLVQHVAGVDAVVCNRGIDHAFTLKYSHVTADIVSDWFISEFKRRVIPPTE